MTRARVIVNIEMFTITLALVICQERVTILTFCIFALVRLDAASTKFCAHQMNIKLQEAKMSSLVWICHQLNSSRNQRIVINLDLAWRHCTKSLPGVGLAHDGWKERIFSWRETLRLSMFLLEKPPPCICYIRQFYVKQKYNHHTNASFCCFRCLSVKVPVHCHRLGQVLSTLSKKLAFPCQQIVHWRLLLIMLIVSGNQGKMQPSLHSKRCRLEQASGITLRFLSTPVTKEISRGLGNLLLKIFKKKKKNHNGSHFEKKNGRQVLMF